MKVCCGFGHREVCDDITVPLETAIFSAIKEGCDVFLTGAMGQFDNLFSSAVRKAKETYPKIKLICVRPYYSNSFNLNNNAVYDDIIIPHELANVHPKAAIRPRNRWIVDNSDIVITYTRRETGGAYEAKRYAYEKEKIIVEL